MLFYIILKNLFIFTSDCYSQRVVYSILERSVPIGRKPMRVLKQGQDGFPFGKGFETGEISYHGTGQDRIQIYKTSAG